MWWRNFCISFISPFKNAWVYAIENTERFIPLVIIAFRKKDGGISGCSKKSAPQAERFFDNRYNPK
jgi:hypothetical protein